MASDPSQVIVTTEDNPPQSVLVVSVHHRDFPELRGEGGTSQDAAARLAELLLRALDSAPSHWRRDLVERAIEDVRAFAKCDRSESAGGLPAIPPRDEDSRE